MYVCVYLCKYIYIYFYICKTYRVNAHIIQMRINGPYFFLNIYIVTSTRLF